MSGANINCPSPAKEASRIRPWANVAQVTIRHLLGAVFLMAAISKIVNLRDFENQVWLHSPIPQALSTLPMSLRVIRAFVIFLPWLELTCGLCLILGRAVRESAAIISLLLSLFIVQALVFRSDDCHCFFLPSVVPTLPWWWHPARDAVLLIGSVYLVFKGRPRARNSESLG
jgi:putative oxidoreductase